jgi:type VI protein secretion system component Hcp
MRWMSYKFTDVLVTEYKVGGSSETSAETVGLNFGKLEIKTFGTDSKGVIKEVGTATWDVKNNKK